MKHLFCLAMIFSFAACRDSDELEPCSEEKIEELELEVGKLEEKIERIESQVGNVTGSVLRLRNEIEDFGRENWQINVPDVEYEFEQLRRSVSELEREF